MKKILSLLILISFFASCSGDEDNTPVNNDPQPVQQHPLVKQVKKQFADGSSETLNFEYSDNRPTQIKKIVYDDGSFDEFLYNDYYEIIRINRIKNGNITEYTLLEYDTYGPDKKTHYVLRNNAEPLVYETSINHNRSDNYVVVQSSENDSSFTEQRHVYTLISSNFYYLEDLINNTASSFEADEKRCPFIHASNFDDLRYILPGITGSRNITLERKYINGVNAGQVRYDYIYNDFYPTEVKRYNNASNQLLDSTTYTYYNL
jgi:hypothetical protein